MYYDDVFITTDDWNEMSIEEREQVSADLASLNASHSEHVGEALDHHYITFIGPPEDIPF